MMDEERRGEEWSGGRLGVRLSVISPNIRECCGCGKSMVVSKLAKSVFVHFFFNPSSTPPDTPPLLLANFLGNNCNLQSTIKIPLGQI